MRQLNLATSWGDLRLVGGSRAGEGSLVLLPQLRLALDAGRPARALVPLQHVVVSHGHLDHLLGLPAWASQRQLQGIPGGTVWVERSQAAAVADLLAVTGRLEGGKPYDVEVRATAAGESAPLRHGFELSFFATSHWVPTGFTVSGVLATIMTLTLEFRIRSAATWAARLVSDWLSATTTLMG